MQKHIHILEDCHIEINNNQAERFIKPFVVGRKNFLSCNTLKATRRNAVIYRIIEMAKEYRLNLYAYINHLFGELLNLDLRDLLWCLRINWTRSEGNTSEISPQMVIWHVKLFLRHHTRCAFFQLPRLNLILKIIR